MSPIGKWPNERQARVVKARWFVVHGWDRFARGKMAPLETVLSSSEVYSRRAI